MIKGLKIFKYSFYKDFIYLLPIILFILFISLILFYKTGSKIYLQGSDFLFYHSYANNFFGDLASRISEEIVLKNDISNTYKDYLPSPLYPIIGLLPITIFGSDILFYIQGNLLAISILYLSYKLLVKLKNEHNLNLNIRLFLFLFISYPTFMQDMLLSSTMSFSILFMLIGFNSKNLFIRNLFFSLVSFIRANFIVFIFSYAFILFFYKESGYKNKLRFLILPLITYLYCYFNIYIDYPGTFLTYFFNTAGIQYDDWINYGNNLFKQKISELDIYNWKPNIFQIINLLNKDIEINIFLIHNFLLKILTIIGAQFNGLWEVKYDFWPARLYKTFYFLLFNLVGIFNILKLKFSSAKIENKFIKKTYLFLLIYLSFSGFLIAGARYFLPLHGILLFSALNYWGFNSFKLKKYIQN